MYKNIRPVIFLFFISSCIGCRMNRVLINDVTFYGAIANDDKSDDVSFLKAMKTNKVVLIPKGEFHLSNLIITDNKTLKGKGNKTKLIKILGEEGSILQIDGSNVVLENVALYGNLFKEKGEWNHGINIRPLYKNISNIKIKNIAGHRLHGDLISVGGFQGIPSNIEIINVSVDSCYRNGISITSGENILIKKAKLENCGMFGIDLEIDNGSSEQISDVKVINSVMSKFVISGESGNIIKNVVIKNCIVDFKLFINIFPKLGDPPFYPELCLLRNCQNIKFKNVSFKNSPFSAIRYIDGQKKFNIIGIDFDGINIEKFDSNEPVFNMPEDHIMRIKNLKIFDSNLVEIDENLLKN